MDLYHALKKARIYQKKLSLIIKMFAQEAEYHMNVITGQKSCSHHNLNHAHHLSYHHEMMVSCDEHSLSLHPYKDFVDDVAWTLQDLVWKREGQLEDQKLIRILNTIYNQAEHKPMTSEEIAQFYVASDNQYENEITANSVSDTALAEAQMDLDTAKQLLENRNTTQLFTLHPEFGYAPPTDNAFRQYHPGNPSFLIPRSVRLLTVGSYSNPALIRGVPKWPCLRDDEPYMSFGLIDPGWLGV